MWQSWKFNQGTVDSKTCMFTNMLSFCQDHQVFYLADGGDGGQDAEKASSDSTKYWYNN